MSSTRLGYDTCAYNTRLGESKDIFDHVVWAPYYENCNKCVTNPAEEDRQRIGTRVDVESDLRIITRLNSLCPDARYKPCGPDNMAACRVYPTITPYTCERDIINFYNLPRNFNIGYHPDTKPCNLRK